MNCFAKDFLLYANKHLRRERVKDNSQKHCCYLEGALLSERNLSGRLRLAANHFKHRMKVSVDKSHTISK